MKETRVAGVVDVCEVLMIEMVWWCGGVVWRTKGRVDT
jgi:hypothetical protein